MSRIHDLSQYGQITNARWIPVAICKPSPFQARIDLGEQEMDELTKSIKAHGVEVPGLVRPVRGGFEIIDGHRRHTAATRAGKELWPVLVEELEDVAAAERGWRDNVERKSFTDWEEANGVDKLAKLWAKELDQELNESQIARKLNRSRTYVANAYEVLGLPKPLLEVAKSVNGAKSALLLVAKSVSPEDQREFAEVIQTNRPSYRKVEKMVEDYKAEKALKAESRRPDAPTRKAMSRATERERNAAKETDEHLKALETATRQVCSWYGEMSPDAQREKAGKVQSVINRLGRLI